MTTEGPLSDYLNEYHAFCRLLTSATAAGSFLKHLIEHPDDHIVLLYENGLLHGIHQVVVVDGDGVVPEYLLYLALAGRGGLQRPPVLLPLDRIKSSLGQNTRYCLRYIDPGVSASPFLNNPIFRISIRIGAYIPIIGYSIY